MVIFSMNSKCTYCGCSSTECLVKCVKTGLCFCNGKGDSQSSHIIHHLKSIESTEISLFENNPLYDQLLCYVCGTKNIFNLGFISNDEDTVFIVCKGCQYGEIMAKKQVNHNKFFPMVSDNQLISYIAKVPTLEQYKKVPISQITSINEGILNKLKPKNNNFQNFKHLSKFVYQTEENYLETMNKLIEYEHNDMSKNEISSIFGISWQNQYQCRFRSTSDFYKKVRVGSNVKIIINNIEKEAKIISVVSQSEVVARFHEIFNINNEISNGEIILIPNIIQLEREKNALRKFSKGSKFIDSFLKKVILGQIENFKEENKIYNSEIQFYHPPDQYFHRLNSSQEKAIIKSLNQKFTLIQGPPGTGKTTVVASLAYSFVKSGIKPILVCTNSNIATDFALQRIAQTGLNVVRVLSTIIEEVNPFSEKLSSKYKARERFQDEYIKLENSNNKEDKNTLRQLETLIIKEADVICTTCIASGGYRLDKINFPVVIFDESGQIIDPDLLIPITHGAKQVILVGDHKQLGPHIMSNEAQLFGLGIPLMTRLVGIQIYPLPLTYQYRMHPGLSKFPSKTFYSDLLKDGISIQDRNLNIKNFNWPNNNLPLIFWNFPNSREEIFENGQSYFNVHEIGACAIIISTLYKSGISSNDIGIISPYSGQQFTLKNHLPSKLKNEVPIEFLNNIQIESVDAFQGKEKKFIILSTVRANDNNDIGFLKDPKRLNVALTRSQYGLFILCSAPTFSKSPLWVKLIDYCINNDVFVEGNFNQLIKSNFRNNLNNNEIDLDQIEETFD